MMISHKKGFTLIELLVVIAIIGILSSVVLASLNTARTKGADAAIKQNLSGIRPQADIYYDDETKGNGTYGVAFNGGTAGDCSAEAGTLFADETIAGQYTSAAQASGPTSVASCVSSATSWALSVPLRSDPTVSWCVDSLGMAKEVTNTGDRGFLVDACE
ncbi:MAG: type II secretion system protein [Candidatus Pacebacteria bacterium]|jgi:prepilin-type N-terminal cleavage/methylation domain-containing protein|nr:type II secretion system protein [Candidatus Paceibacterota bacterium]